MTSIHTYTINLRALKAVAIAASSEEVRYYLNGVFVEFEPSQIVFTATDGHRLIAASHDYLEGEKGPDKKVVAIVPTTLLDKVKLGKKDNGQALLTIDCTQAAVKVSLEYLGAIYSEAAIDATYPDARRVVPRTVSGEVAKFNPHYLVSFEKARAIATNEKVGEDCIIAHNGGSPALVDMNIVGEEDGFRMFGVIMPMRGWSHATTAPAWFIGETETQQAEAA